MASNYSIFCTRHWLANCDQCGVYSNGFGVGLRHSLKHDNEQRPIRSKQIRANVYAAVAWHSAPLIQHSGGQGAGQSSARSSSARHSPLTPPYIDVRGCTNPLLVYGEKRTGTQSTTKRKTLGWKQVLWNRWSEDANRPFRWGSENSMAIRSKPLITKYLSYGLSYSRREILRQGDPSEFWIYVGAARCQDGRNPPAVGWAFIFGGDVRYPTEGVVSGRLENTGPLGFLAERSFLHAVVRATLGALRFRNWGSVGCSTLVVATDSAYLAYGAAGGIREDMHNWWFLLLGELERLQEHGVTVKFWYVRSNFNPACDAAQQAAVSAAAAGEYQDWFGWFG